MQIKLRDDKKILTTLLVLSVVAVLISFFGVLVSDVVLPVSAALIAVIFSLENGRKKYFSIIVSVLIVVANVVSVLLLGGFVFSGFEAIILAAIIAVCFSKNFSKADTAVILTAASVFFFFVNASAFAMITKGQFDFQTVKEFYNGFYDTVKSQLLDSLPLLNAYLPEDMGSMLISSEALVTLLNSFVAMLISYIVIFAFAVSGISLKLFSFISLRLTSEKNDVLNWRFRTGNVFAYFYLALFVIQVFTGGQAGLFAVAIANLSNIFCIVYAYLGFNFAISLLVRKHSIGFSFIMLLIGLALFSSFMIEILSVIGAFVTISENKRVSKQQ